MTSSGKWDRYLAGESVTCLALRSAQDDARRGMEVWAGTANGQVVRLNATDGALTRYTLSDQSAPVAGVAVDPAGRVWAATRGRGLFVFATPDATGTPAWQPYTAANSGLPSDVVSAVTIDAGGTVWCGTDMAVNRLILKGTGVLTGTWQLFPVPIPASGPPMDQVTALTAEGTDTIWVGLLGNYRTELGRNVNGGLFRLTPGNPPTWERVLSDDVGTIRAIFVGPDGHKWVATSLTEGTSSSARGGGVVVWNGEKWMLYEALGAGMPSRYVTGVAVDARGRTWIITDKGLVVYEGTRRTIYQASASGLVSNRVTAIALSEDGSAWIATDAGLCHLLEQ
jgi:ligand-binding sensor domain-containing protein